MEKILKDLNKKTQDKLKARINRDETPEQWYSNGVKDNNISFLLWLEAKR